MTFSFSLYTMPLLAILVIYFESRLRELSGLELLEGSKVCHSQHQKSVLVHSIFRIS